MIKIKNREQLHILTALLVGEQANEPERVDLSQLASGSVMISVLNETGKVERYHTIHTDGTHAVAP